MPHPQNVLKKTFYVEIMLIKEKPNSEKQILYGLAHMRNQHLILKGGPFQGRVREKERVIRVNVIKVHYICV
jgi:hypothetical protein